ncbi:type IIL restriction-modification enzyme MmeI [Paeniglutamicibacter sp. Y32M11]|uniref:Eco57I restriction-modification methylase domain-containing protein n=1 Tax=Paeniglutamicibacter sp. Y32M11 TaxID=2853258 RepID=UPI001C52BB9E|nr:type IIL restriction-modification enzyme MmeI [Paeniglutamicibacter sp. Y32M11]QXQ11301.1 SAM-dependent DNA methyltransferase [Paeniglutamicibacter sp. Y32M11]
MKSHGTQRRTREHRDWLELVDRDGPFVAIPAIKRVWPQGMPQLGASAKAALRDAKPNFDRAWDDWSKGPTDDDAAVESYRGARNKWIDAVLRDVARWDAHLVWDDEELGGSRPRGASAKHMIGAKAAGKFVREGVASALVMVFDPVDSLRDPLNDAWTASPIDRMDALLRKSEQKVGVVTDGRWWAIICAQDGVMTASGIVDAQTWIEESDVRDAFLELISPQRLAGGSESDRLPELFRESITAAEDITVALGTQVRRAVELLVTAFSEEAFEAREAGWPDPLPADRVLVYEGAVTAMMRVVFLLFAEERSMMPQSPLFTEAYGVSGLLDDLDKRIRDEGPEALDATHYTWHRLLATSKALYGGVTSEDVRLPAYGGSLFDPERFLFLTGIDERGALAIAVNDRVMLEVLRAVQYAVIGTGKSAERRRVSFRDIDVEQIGYIYEGLLGYTAKDVDEVTVGLVGKDGEEPEIPLRVLEELVEANPVPAEFVASVIAWVKKKQPAATTLSAAALPKLLDATVEDGERALLSVTRDDALLARLRPFLGIIRRDLREWPVVIQPGGLAVVETPSRANSGAHYTPKSLAQEVVRYALEPLVFQPGPHQTADESQWKLLDSNEILDLKIADIACGSGAFLVAAAEYLAEKVINAWHAEGITGSPHELEIKARRQVVAHCLYGADINGMAVEMCKISLWLVSLDPRVPFSFVDDKVLHGNSLLGITDLRQLEAGHIDPSRVKTLKGGTHYSSGTLFGEGSEAQGLHVIDVQTVVQKAVRLRQGLANVVDENDPARSTKTKRRIWDEYQGLISQLSDLADGVIAAGLIEGGKPSKKLDEQYVNLRIAADRAFAPNGKDDRAMLKGIIDKGLTPSVETDYERWKPLHWALAVPDVMERGGFDAIIGNPPFLVGKKISGVIGVEHRAFLVNQIAGGITGNTDLVAFFLLRATRLLTQAGTLGLVTAKVIAEGDTREVGLDTLVAAGFKIQRAIRSEDWPAKSAATRYSVIWGGFSVQAKERVLDGKSVALITPSLEEGGRVVGIPFKLAQNKGLSFKGYDLGGDGFQLSEAEARDMIETDPRNGEVLFRYLNGKDLTSNPDLQGETWVISFGTRTLAEAREYRAPFDRVRDLVYPVRMRSNRKAHRDRWWIYSEARPSLTERLAGSSAVIGISAVSVHAAPMIIPVGAIMSSAIVVIPDRSFSNLAVLSSSVHSNWVLRWGSLLDLRVRYSTTDVLDTFPLPQVNESLDSIGKELDVKRRKIMLERGLGVTKLYNLVNDPDVTDRDQDINELRQMQVRIDHAVMNAYGWSDIPLEHSFHEYRKIFRWTVDPSARVRILDRLLEENHRRAALQSQEVSFSSSKDSDDE